MKALNNLVDKSVENYKKKEGVEKAFDPAIIFVFSDLIMQLMAAIKGCKSKPEDAVSLMRSPTLLQKVVARRTVRKNLDRADKQHGQAITEALFETGKTASLSDVSELYNELD